MISRGILVLDFIVSGQMMSLWMQCTKNRPQGKLRSYFLQSKKQIKRHQLGMPSKNQDKRAGRWILVIEQRKRPQLTILMSVSTIQPEIEQPMSMATHHYSKDQNIMIIIYKEQPNKIQICLGYIYVVKECYLCVVLDDTPPNYNL